LTSNKLVEILKAVAALNSPAGTPKDDLQYMMLVLWNTNSKEDPLPTFDFANNFKDKQALVR
jgi:hypothetical protein